MIWNVSCLPFILAQWSRAQRFLVLTLECFFCRTPTTQEQGRIRETENTGALA